MPNIKSAEKRVSVSATKKLQNQKIRSQMSTAIKKFNAAISEGNVELAKSLLPTASSKIDNAAVKHVIHKNAANRKKGQLAKALSQLERGIVVVKVDAKTLKQQEQRAAAAKKAAEAEVAKAERNAAKKAKEAAKAPAPAKKPAAKKATAAKAPKAAPAAKEAPAEEAPVAEAPAKAPAAAKAPKAATAAKSTAAAKKPAASTAAKKPAASTAAKKPAAAKAPKAAKPAADETDEIK